MIINSGVGYRDYGINRTQIKSRVLEIKREKEFEFFFCSIIIYYSFFSSSGCIIFNLNI